MKIQLVMLDTPVIVSDEELKEGDLFCMFRIGKIPLILKHEHGNKDTSYANELPSVKIIAELPQIDWNGMEEQFGYVDVIKKADTLRKRNSIIEHEDPHTNVFESGIFQGYLIGFKEAKQLSKKKFNEEDIEAAIRFGENRRKMDEGEVEYITQEQFIQSLFKTKVFSIEVEKESYTVGEMSNLPLGTVNSKPKITNGKIKITKKL